MEKAEYLNIYQNEGSHFFYLANRKIVISLLKKFLPKGKLKVLDAGCGTGDLAMELSQYGLVWAIDLSPVAVGLAKKRGLKVKRASIEKTSFPSNYFQVVTCIDVIYHRKVKSDLKALQEIFRVLSPGGVLLIRVPGVPWLQSAHDEFVHTRERYSKDRFAKILKKSGFKILKLSYLNSLLLFPSIFQTVKQRVLPQEPRSSILRLSPAINSFLFYLLIWEELFLKFTNLPFGIGIVAVAKKPKL